MTPFLGRTLAIGVLVLLSAPHTASGQTEIRARSATLTVGGRLHAQASASSAEEAVSFDTFLRRARVFVGIEINDFLDARILPDFAGGKTALQDAYVRLNFDPAFRVSMGQFKRASEVFELDSSTRLAIIERDGRVAGVDDCTGVAGVCSFSRMMEKLEYSGRDTGVRIDGAVGRFSYVATATNGTGINVKDENAGKSYAARAQVEVAEGVAVGGFLGFHDYLDGTGDTEYATAFGADLNWGGWTDGPHLQAAIAGGDNWKELGAAGDPVTFVTGQAVLTYYVPLDSERWSGIEPLGRISFADPDTDTDEDAAWIFTPGLSLFISGRNKIGTNLDIYVPDTGGTEVSFKLQTFLYF